MPDTILRPPAGCPPQMFGAAIAAYGDRLLIGAPCLDYLVRLDEGIPAPAAALFVRAGSGWADCAVVHAAEPASAEGFGRSVALTDRFAIVGAPGHETGDAAAYVFRRNGNSLAPHAALPPPGHDPFDDVMIEYGAALACDDARLAVGAPLAFDGPPGDPDAALRGELHLFDMRANPPTPAGTRHGPQPDEDFARAVALSGDLMAAGAPGTFSNEQSAGAVYVFSRGADGEWRELCRLGGRDPGEEFGAAVALDGARLAVGAPGRADLPLAVGGRVDLFDIDASGCRPIGSCRDTPGFGRSIAMLGGRLAVGQPEWDAPDGTPRAGRVRLLHVNPAAALADIGWLAAPGPAGAYARLGSAVALGPDYVAAGAPGLPGDDASHGFVLVRPF